MLVSKAKLARKRKPPKRTKAHLAVLVRRELKDEIATAAAKNGNSLTREAELRLERSFRDDELLNLMGGNDMRMLALIFGRLLNALKDKHDADMLFADRASLSEARAMFDTFFERYEAALGPVETDGSGATLGSVAADYMLGMMGRIGDIDGHDAKAFTDAHNEAQLAAVKAHGVPVDDRRTKR